MSFEKVLVTGGNGRLGRFVMAALQDRPLVRALDIQPGPDQADYHHCNILDPAGLASACRGYDAIIHLAGIDDGDAPEERDYFSVNVQGAWNLLQAAEDEGVRKVVLASSSAAYGLGYDRPPFYLPVDEKHPLLTTGTYGLSKQVIETLAAHYALRGGLETLCLRPTLVVRPEKEQAILAQLALANPDEDVPREADEGVVPYGALSASRTYVRSEDAARAFVLALDTPAGDQRVFNIAAGDGIGRPDALARYQSIFGAPATLAKDATFADDPFASGLSSRLAREVLGWQAQGDWRDVEKAWRGEKND